jgi:hypothetical protein
MLHRDSSRYRDKFTLFKETHPFDPLTAHDQASLAQQDSAAAF